jgi:hypothetical protein
MSETGSDFGSEVSLVGWHDDVIEKLQLQSGDAGLVSVHHFYGPIAHCLLEVALREKLFVDQ